MNSGTIRELLSWERGWGQCDTKNRSGDGSSTLCCPTLPSSTATTSPAQAHPSDCIQVTASFPVDIASLPHKIDLMHTATLPFHHRQWTQQGSIKGLPWTHHCNWHLNPDSLLLREDDEWSWDTQAIVPFVTRHSANFLSWGTYNIYWALTMC